MIVREGKTLISDGPFFETKEQIGHFILIDAPSVEAAIRIAAGMPLAKLGTIEVRGIYEVPR